ncbi:CrcB family protein, partial [Frankia sp. AiPs1]|nr:CrcB family protein [Frankia sp. AiPs1]
MAERPAPQRVTRGRPVAPTGPVAPTEAGLGTSAEPGAATAAADPDVDLHLAAQRAELRARPVPLLGAIAAGG